MKKIIALIASCIMFSATVISANAAADVAALMYHSVTKDPTRWDDYTISPDQLDEDIKYFTDCGYITMTATELATADMANIDGKKILLLTFDDGYSNFYTDILPVLQKHNAKATMYLIGSYINRYGYLTEDQAYELAHSGLVEIGNHTDIIHQTPVELLHQIYPDTNLFFDVITDIKNNEERLEEIIDMEITSMSWPYGYYTPAVDKGVKEHLGYKISFSTQYGVTKFNGDTSTPLNRMNREHAATTQEVFDRANGLLYQLSQKQQ